MRWYLFLDLISYSELTVFLERKTVRFSKQLTSVDYYWIITGLLLRPKNIILNRNNNNNLVWLKIYGEVGEQTGVRLDSRITQHGGSREFLIVQ